MHNPYADIRSRISEPPAWFDENGVPRYGPFEVSCLADIYADEAALVLIRCQGCQTPFNVAFSRHTATEDYRAKVAGVAPRSLADRIIDGSLHYGDPPNIGCCPAGPTMNSVPVHVGQYWRRIKGEWYRDASLEQPLDAWEEVGEITINNTPRRDTEA